MTVRMRLINCTNEHEDISYNALIVIVHAQNAVTRISMQDTTHHDTSLTDRRAGPIAVLAMNSILPN